MLSSLSSHTIFSKSLESTSALEAQKTSVIKHLDRLGLATKERVAEITKAKDIYATLDYLTKSSKLAVIPILEHKPIQITHVKMMHYHPNLECLMKFPESDFVDAAIDLLEQAIITSQFNVMQQIQKQLDTHPDACVFEEGVCEDLTSEKLLAQDPNFKFVKSFFLKDGIPESPDLLTSHQRFILGMLGAVKTMLLLEKIPKIYSTTSPDFQNIVRDFSSEKINIDHTKGFDDIIQEAQLKFKSENPLHDDLITTQRELMAIKQMKITAAKTGVLNCLLVFGVAHNFERRIQSLGDPSVIYQKGIETTHESFETKFDNLIQSHSESKEKQVSGLTPSF